MAKDCKRDTEAPAEPAHTFGNRRSEHRTGSEVSEDLGAVKAPEIEDTAPQEVAVEGGDLAILDSEARAIKVVQPPRGSGSRMPYDTYRSIILLLREGVPVVHVSDRFGIATTTIHEMKKRHEDIVPPHRDVMARKSENLREVLSDKMIETVQSGRMSPNQYAFTYGVISQHYQTETGQGGPKHAHVHINLDKNDLGSLLSGAKPNELDTESSKPDQNDHKNSVDV